MREIWWNVWAVEHGERPPAQLLFSFPDEQRVGVHDAIEQLVAAKATVIRVEQIIKEKP